MNSSRAFEPGRKADWRNAVAGWGVRGSRLSMAHVRSGASPHFGASSGAGCTARRLRRTFDHSDRGMDQLDFSGVESSRTMTAREDIASVAGQLADLTRT